MNRSPRQAKIGHKLQNPKKAVKTRKTTKSVVKQIKRRQTTTSSPLANDVSAPITVKNDPNLLDLTTTPNYPLSPKPSTRISGLPAIPNGREVLDNLLVHTIELARQHSKKDGEFIWTSIENNALFRLNVLRAYPTDDHMVERIIGAGQIEELVEQHEEELTLFDTYDMKVQQINPDLMKGAASAFGAANPKCETRIFPLPDEVAQEIATGKVTVNPYHPTKPLSRKFIQHLGFGDELTAEDHTAYDSLMVLTDEDKATQAKNMKDIHGVIRSDVEANMIYKQGKPLEEQFYSFFNTSFYVHPELDKEYVAQTKEAFELHIRKL